MDYPSILQLYLFSAYNFTSLPKRVAQDPALLSSNQEEEREFKMKFDLTHKKILQKLLYMTLLLTSFWPKHIMEDLEMDSLLKVANKNSGDSITK